MRVFDFTNVYPYRSTIYKIKTSAGVNPHTPSTTKRRSAKNQQIELSEMAIFIASTKSISRGKGQSAVASASYRAGVELEDKRYGKTHDYSKKHGVISADIILPTALAAANADIDRADLWNKAESAEKRKDARVAREWLVNLPHELSEEDRKELAHTFAQTLADRYGTIADCAIHQPTQKEIDRGADPRNFHAHIMFTTRTAEIDDNNEILLTDKATIELSDTKRHKLGMERVSLEIKEVRQLWEQLANEKLAEHKHDLIDCRSYADQGKDIKPQLKMGSVATKLERDAYVQAKATAESNGTVLEGIPPVTIRGEINRLIAERNQSVARAELARYQKPYDANDHIMFKRDHTNERNTETARAIEWTKPALENLSDRNTETARAINDVSARVDSTKRLLAERSDTAKQQAAPNPYDINYDRAFFERKRQADRAIRESIRVLESTKLGNAQRVADVEDAVKTLTYRLLDRRKEGLFDNRQLIMLDDFAKKLGINENQSSDFKQNVRLATDKINTVEVLENNPHVFRLLNFPSQEREHYQTVTADFDRFIAHVDKQRAELKQKYQSKLGRNDTSRVTAEILTVEPYLAALTKYANNSEKTDESKALAEQHIDKTIRLTAKQYEIAYKGLTTLDSNESVQKHVRELGNSLSTFTNDYAEKLTESDLGSINDCLKVIDTGVEISNTSQIRNNLSPSF